MDKSYLKLKETFNLIQAINNSLSILYWDSSVIMPKDSLESRANQISTLKLLVLEILSSEKISDLINNVNAESLDNWNKANFNLMKKIYKQTIVVDKKLTESHAIACTKSEMIWRTAKEDNNFKLFAPYFKEVLFLTKEVALAKASVSNCSIYDALLDTYDPRLTIKDIDPIFDDLKDFLPKFIKKIAEKESRKNNHSQCSEISLPISIQKEIGLECMKLFGFNFNKGRLDISEHPFTGGYAEDTRITSKYKENDFLFGLMAIIHETGHALYQQNLPSQWINQPVGLALGMSIHESQSLIFEKQICKSREFLYFLSGLLNNKFSIPSSKVSEDILYKSLNTVKPSLIRIEADEVTYPIHVILRYELEKSMILGDLQIDDLPVAWNEKMDKYLGIKPSTDREGCLQDIHWPSGIFGYFPSYLMGAIMASQLYDCLNKDIPNNNQLIALGEFSHIKTWLNKSIHQYGSLYSTQELLEKATGKKICVNDYKNYLNKKFLS